MLWSVVDIGINASPGGRSRGCECCASTEWRSIQDRNPWRWQSRESMSWLCSILHQKDCCYSGANVEGQQVRLRFPCRKSSSSMFETAWLTLLATLALLYEVKSSPVLGRPDCFGVLSDHSNPRVLSLRVWRLVWRCLEGSWLQRHERLKYRNKCQLCGMLLPFFSHVSSSKAKIVPTTNLRWV